MDEALKAKIDELDIKLHEQKETCLKNDEWHNERG